MKTAFFRLSSKYLGMPQRILFSIIFLSLSFTSFLSTGQRIFDSFTVLNRGGKNHINWVFNENYNQSVKRIGIQRSRDSTTFFSTIGHAADPKKNANSYIDKKPLKGSNLYRLFILFKNGSYQYSKPTKIILIPGTLTNSSSHFPTSFQPSIFVYTNADGNVNISLHDPKKNDYTIRFYDEANHFLFEIKDIKKRLLIIDKVNFLHSGWFHYKLYKNGKIFERWKFYITGKKEKNQ